MSGAGKLASELIQALLKARKNLRLYPENNPIYSQTVAETHRRMGAYFDEFGSLELFISRNEIKREEEVVFSSEQKEDNLALMLFRDGLRSLTFNVGLDKEELQSFLLILSVDFDSENVEEDIVTMLWEQDFHNIRYQVDESILMEGEDYEEKAVKQATEDANTEGGVGSAYAEAQAMDEPVEGIVPISVSNEDLELLEKEVEKEKQSKVPKLIDIMFELLYSSESLEEFKDISAVVKNALEFLVKNKHLTAAVEITKRVKEMVDKVKNAEAQKLLLGVVSYAGSPEIVGVIGEWLDSKKGVNEAVFKDYVSVLESASIPQFINLLGELQTISGRKGAIYALSVLGKKDLKPLVAGLNDSRWFVVRNIVVIMRNINEKRVLDYIDPVMSHKEPRVIKEAIKLLGDMGGPKSIKLLAAQMKSVDHSTRVLAAQALSRTGSPEGKLGLIEMIMDKDFQNSELAEMKPFFEALSRYRSRDVFDFYMGMLDKTPFFGRNKYNEMKACAIYGLGLLGSTQALPALEELMGAKDKIISDYAVMSIKRIQNVQQQRK